MAETPNAYRIEITIPLGLPAELRERLIHAVADVVHDWEPDDRVGWDAFVAGHAVYDELSEDVSSTVRGGGQ